MRHAQLVVFMLVVSCWTPATAETLQPIDPATVVVPDLSFQPTKRDVEGYGDYFYFHKDGVSFANALTDIKECSSYSLAITPFKKIPDFVPIGGDPDPNAKSDYNGQISANSFLMRGMAGAIVVGFIVDGETRSVERGNTRRCMGYLGYQRYACHKRSGRNSLREAMKR